MSEYQEPPRGTDPPEPEPQYVNYPRHQVSGFDLSAISEAWRLWIGNLAPYAVTGALMLVATTAVGVVGMVLFLPAFFASMMAGEENLLGFGLAMGSSFLAQFLISVLSYVVSAPFLASLTYMGLKDASGETRATLEDLSYGFKNHLPQTLTYGVVMGLISLVGSLIPCIAGLVSLVVYAFLILAMPLIIDRRLAVLDALKTSFNITSKNFGLVLVYTLVTGLISMMGALACIIGVLVTAGFIGVAMAVAYVRLGDPAPTYTAPEPGPYTPPPAAPMTPADLADEEMVPHEADQGDTLADPGAEPPPHDDTTDRPG